MFTATAPFRQVPLIPHATRALGRWFESFKPKGQPQTRRKKRSAPEWTQMRLRPRNDPPLRKKKAIPQGDPIPEEKPMPLWMSAAREWTVARFQQGHGRTTEGIALLFLIRLMRPDDVLKCGSWALELVWLGEGYPHYRLYWRDRFYGGEDIPVEWGRSITVCPSLRHIQSDMAAYLALTGFKAESTAFVKGLARTPVSLPKKEMIRLFELPEKKAVQKDENEGGVMWPALIQLYARRTLELEKQRERIDAYGD